LSNGHKGPDEHAGIPTVLAAVQIFEGTVKIWFFHKPFGFEESGFVGLDPFRWRQRRAHMNVAVAGGWFGWLDANRDNGTTAACQIKGIAQYLLKFLFLGNYMVGGEHSHNGRCRTRANN